MAVARMAAVLLTALALEVVESPRWMLHCDHENYLDSGGHCCKLCPAGTHVAESCTKPHTIGICAPCTEGKDYTAHANGFQNCLSCDDCKSGFEMVKSCTVKSNTVCQCKAGYYCPPSCEECVRCRTKCPEGQNPVEKCNATTDMKCASPTETKDATSIYIAVAFVLLLLVFIVFGAVALFYWKSTRNGFCQSDEETSPQPWWLLVNQIEKPGPVSENNLPENTDGSDLAAGNTNEALLGSTESTAASLQPNLQGSKKQPEVVVVAKNFEVLKEIYFDSRKMVPLHSWKNLMRKSGLEDNDIEEIVRDHPSETDEQRYQMLKTLQNRYGIKDALLTLLNGMWAMKLTHIYENLTNELKSKGIITLETEN